ncbi:hypothetical protein PM082_021813 [Marasmius tenuissimus]|nr:hypothetical protein PM082_021813 [Marasmius tenuissimus]
MLVVSRTYRAIMKVVMRVSAQRDAFITFESRFYQSIAQELPTERGVIPLEPRGRFLPPFNALRSTRGGGILQAGVSTSRHASLTDQTSKLSIDVLNLQLIFMLAGAEFALFHHLLADKPRHQFPSDYS